MSLSLQKEFPGKKTIFISFSVTILSIKLLIPTVVSITPSLTQPPLIYFSLICFEALLIPGKSTGLIKNVKIVIRYSTFKCDCQAWFDSLSYVMKILNECFASKSTPIYSDKNNTIQQEAKSQCYITFFSVIYLFLD